MTLYGQNALCHRKDASFDTARGKCSRNKSIIPRSQTSTNWNDASTASGPLWVKLLLCKHIQGAANKSNALACVVNISTMNKNFNKKTYTAISHSYYNCQNMLNYHNIRLRYAIWIEATPRLVTCKFHACIINLAS